MATRESTLTAQEIREQLRALSTARREAALATLVTRKEIPASFATDVARHLAAEDTSERMLACAVLERLGQQGARHLHARLRIERQHACRIRIIGALGHLGPDAREAVPTLTRLLESRHDDSRWQASFALGRIGDASVETVHALLKSTQHAATRIACCDALGWIGEGARAADKTVHALTRDEDEVVQSAAWSALHGMRVKEKAALKALTRKLTHADEAVRLDALQRIGECRSSARGVQRDVIARLGDAAAAVRALAALTLARIEADEAHAVPALRKALEDRDAEVRRHAIMALDTHGVGTQDVERSLEPLCRDPSGKVRALATITLKRIKRRQAVPASI